MAKQDLLDEASRLGIEGLDDEFTNKKIQASIDEARAALESAESAEDAEEATEEAPVVEEVAEEPSEAPEPRFTLDQLKPFSERLFGVGYHVIVGAVSSGCISNGRVTKTEVASGIERYMNMPVEQSKES